jgi:hypothetical protein
VPVDPFTDAPFVYEKRPDCVRVSSRGRLAERGAPMTFDEAASFLMAWEMPR